MDIEQPRKDQAQPRPHTTLIKSNHFGCSINSLVFCYSITENQKRQLPMTEHFRDALMKEICKNTPENLLNKLLDMETWTFYAVKQFTTFTFQMLYRETTYDFTVTPTGNLPDNFPFFRAFFNYLLYKSQMIEIDDYYVNPFDIRETEEVSIFPAFKFEYVKLDQSNFISVACDILFSPNLSLLDVVRALRAKNVSDSEIQRVFAGKLVQTKYQSWAKYFKITRVLFNETLDKCTFSREGHRVALSEYFAKKYPFLKIDVPDQILLEAVPVNTRFDTITSQQPRILVPELLQWILSNEDLHAVHGVDFYDESKINKRAMKYFYINKFRIWTR